MTAKTELESKQIPFNQDAEQAILSCMLNNPDALIEAKSKLQESDFYYSSNKVIFNKVMELSNSSNYVDAVTVSEKLSSKDKEICPLTYLAEVSVNCPSQTLYEHYINLVKEKSLLRELLYLCEETKEKINGNMDYEECFSGIESKLNQISDRGIVSKSRNWSDLISESIDGFDSRINGDYDSLGVEPHWDNLRRLIPGFRSGEMVVVGARPSMGKTSFSLNIILNTAISEELPVLFFSLEMKDSDIVGNLMCIESGIDNKTWKKPNVGINDRDKENLLNASKRLSKAKIEIDDNSYLTPSMMKSKIRKFKRKHGELGLVVVDYLQLMNTDKEDFRANDIFANEVGKISKKIKSMAKEFDVPVIVLAQLNRGVENRTQNVPRMSDLKDSGGIEQDADVILLLHRPDYYDPKSRPGETDVIVAKNRQGETGTATLIFQKELVKFVDKG